MSSGATMVFHDTLSISAHISKWTGYQRSVLGLVCMMLVDLFNVHVLLVHHKVEDYEKKIDNYARRFAGMNKHCRDDNLLS